MENYARGLVLIASALPMLSCGGAVGEAVRPDDYTAAGVSGGPNACEGPGKQAKPLIVDLDPDSRVDLEAAMKRGVAVVAFDCKSLRVLTSCKVGDAKYEYAGVSRKEQVIQLTSQDDLAVSLPISSAKLGGEVKSGRSIDLALVRVGQSSAPLGSITRDQLQGSCEGATHVIQTATVGAFSMSTGSVGKVGAQRQSGGNGRPRQEDRTNVGCREGRRQHPRHQGQARGLGRRADDHVRERRQDLGRHAGEGQDDDGDDDPQEVVRSDSASMPDTMAPRHAGRSAGASQPDFARSR
ncbi:MAG: hypothetical protein JNK04_23205 [Myxococcales bacterium]|nr:hypothetical protein [Myxococcales bacterium]